MTQIPVIVEKKIPSYANLALVQKIRQQTLRAYCPNICTVGQGQILIHICLPYFLERFPEQLLVFLKLKKS